MSLDALERFLECQIQPTAEFVDKIRPVLGDAYWHDWSPPRSNAITHDTTQATRRGSQFAGLLLDVHQSRFNLRDGLEVTGQITATELDPGTVVGTTQESLVRPDGFDPADEAMEYPYMEQDGGFVMVCRQAKGVALYSRLPQWYLNIPAKTGPALFPMAINYGESYGADVDGRYGVSLKVSHLTDRQNGVKQLAIGRTETEQLTGGAQFFTRLCRAAVHEIIPEDIQRPWFD